MRIEFNDYEDEATYTAIAVFATAMAAAAAARPDRDDTPAPISDPAAAIPLGTTRTDNTPVPDYTPETIPAPPLAAVPDTPAPVPETPAPAAVTGDLDTSGMPWDARIHSSGKSTIANGTWKVKRGTDPALVEQVRGESTAGSAPAPAPVVEIPAAPNPAAVFGGATTTAAAAAPEVLTWPIVMSRVVPQQSAGTYNKDAEQAFLASHSMGTELAVLAARPDLFESYLQAVGA